MKRTHSGPRYALTELQPGDTQFVRGKRPVEIQNHLSYLRTRRGILKDAEIVVEPSVSGVIIRRVK